MTLFQILILSGVALLAGVLTNAQSRRWVLLAGSVIAMYWMQPSMPIRYMDFWLPTAALALTVWVWVSTRHPHPDDASHRALSLEGRGESASLPLSGREMKGLGDSEGGSVLIILLSLLLVALLRYIEPLCCLTATRPPQIGAVALALGGIAIFAWGLGKGKSIWVVNGFAAFLILLLVVYKTPALAQAVSTGLRVLSGQETDLATSLDIRWLGFSYLAFRLVHVLRDGASKASQSAKRLPELALDEFVIYALFFPAYTAGPIDRVQRFVGDLRAVATQEKALVEFIETKRLRETLLPAGQRIALGIFKKFALADGLALIALNDTNAVQLTAPGWGWVLLYAYALRIYFDFSGYTDIAIGIGMLAGIKLPENFESPYFKPNLTAFWNSWHITLAQWFRAYYFNPLTRTLRGRKLPIPAVIFLTQVTTMILIGLWHGVTWNFFIWGAWHGVGLFIHNRWSDRFRARYAAWEVSPRVKAVLKGAGTLLTFHFVTLGWVWFALSIPTISLTALQIMFGF